MNRWNVSSPGAHRSGVSPRGRVWAALLGLPFVTALLLGPAAAQPGAYVGRIPVGGLLCHNRDSNRVVNVTQLNRDPMQSESASISNQLSLC